MCNILHESPPLFPSPCWDRITDKSISGKGGMAWALTPILAGKAWWQEPKATGPIKLQAGSRGRWRLEFTSLSFLVHLGPQPTVPSTLSVSGQVFLSQLTQSRNSQRCDFYLTPGLLKLKPILILAVCIYRIKSRHRYMYGEIYSL